MSVRGVVERGIPGGMKGRCPTAIVPQHLPAGHLMSYIPAHSSCRVRPAQYYWGTYHLMVNSDDSVQVCVTSEVASLVHPSEGAWYCECSV